MAEQTTVMAEVSEQLSFGAGEDTDSAEKLSKKSLHAEGVNREELECEDGDFGGEGGSNTGEGCFEPEERGTEEGEVNGGPREGGGGRDMLVNSLPSDTDISAEEWQKIKDITSHALDLGSEEEANGAIFHQPGGDSPPNPRQPASTAASSTQESRCVKAQWCLCC